VTGVPGLTRHLSQHPAECAGGVTDRLRGEHIRATGRGGERVDVGDRGPVAGDDLIWGPARLHHHVKADVGVARVAGERLTEPVPFAVGQVLN